MNTKTHQKPSVLQRPVLSYRAIQRATHIVACYPLYYISIYGDSIPAFLKRCYPLMVFTESLVYSVDDPLEAAQRGEIPFTGISAWSEKRAIAAAVFTEIGLYDQCVEHYLEEGSCYWALENEVMYHGKVSVAHLTSAIHLRSFDFRLLHYLAHRILDIPHNDAEFAILTALDIRSELETDLFEYADDVADNSFNLYRMFVNLYGLDAPAKMRAEVERWTCLITEQVACLPTDRRELYQRILDYRYYAVGVHESPAPIPEPIIETHLYDPKPISPYPAF